MTKVSKLRSGLLLLALVESQKRDSHNLAHLEAATGDITLRLTTLSEAGNKHLVVLIYVVKATITRHEASDLLSVLDELHTHTLADGRVRLLGLKTTVCVRWTKTENNATKSRRWWEERRFEKKIPS